MAFICPKCQKSREPRERVARKDGKSWLIESCPSCGFNIEITEWNKEVKQIDSPKGKTGWFKPKLR